MSLQNTKALTPALGLCLAVVGLVALSSIVFRALAHTLPSPDVPTFTLVWAALGVAVYLPSCLDHRPRYRGMSRVQIIRELLSSTMLSAIVGPGAIFMVMAIG